MDRNTFRALSKIKSRLDALEKHSHEPFDFTHLIARLERVEKYIDDLETGSKELADMIRRQGE